MFMNTQAAVVADPSNQVFIVRVRDETYSHQQFVT